MPDLTKSGIYSIIVPMSEIFVRVCECFMKKWHKIALIIIVVVGVLVSIKSCVDKKDADITLAYIGDGFVNRELYEENVKLLQDICTDINSDGEVNIGLMEISFNEALSQADKQNSDSRLANAVGAGAARVYFIEEKYVISNASSGVFEDLSQLGDGFKNAAGEVVAINIQGNERAKMLGIDTEDEIYLALRLVSEMDTVTDKHIGKRHAMAWDIAEYILKD